MSIFTLIKYQNILTKKNSTKILTKKKIKHQKKKKKSNSALALLFCDYWTIWFIVILWQLGDMHKGDFWTVWQFSFSLYIFHQQIIFIWSMHQIQTWFQRSHKLPHYVNVITVFKRLIVHLLISSTTFREGGTCFEDWKTPRKCLYGIQ